MRISDCSSDVCSSDLAKATVDIKRVPETIAEDVLKKIGAKLDQAAPIVTVEDLPNYDAIIFGTPTRYGNMTGQMRTFLDQTGSLWVKGALVGKVGSVFTSSAKQHGGQESTILSFHFTPRSEERRVGKECGRTYRSRWSPYH